MAAKDEPESENKNIEDAEVIEPEAEAPSDDDPETSTESPEELTEDAPETGDATESETPEEGELTEEPVAVDLEPEELEEPVEDAAPEAEPEPIPEPEPAPAAAAPQKRGGFSALLGGAIAAVLGFVVAQAVPDGWPVTADTAVTDALAAADGDLSTRIDGIDATASDMAAQLEATRGTAAEIQSAIDGVAASVAALNDRVDALEGRPIVDLSSLENSEAVEAELAALREEIAAVSAEAQRQIDEARSEATLLERNAAAAADAAAERAALSRVLAALDSGVPFEATLGEFAELTDQEIPAALTASASDGVPTLTSLQADFPAVAREALGAMRDENAGGESTLGNFFRNQLSVRSLEPQEGSSPDAVLSRIEGALTEGRLQDALAEIATLPESGASILAPWSAQAEARLAAFEAAGALTQSMTSN